MPDDYSANILTSGVVPVGGTAIGRIDTTGDRDWFAVELVAGGEYQIDLRGRRTGDGTLGDPYLRGIHDAEGNLISGTTNDDGGAGYNSRVTFTASETGTYYIAAGAYSGRGTYELEVTELAAPQEQTTGDAPVFEVQGYAFSLAENADGGTVPVSLGLVQATDPENSTITYSIEGGDPGGVFAIDPGTGALSYRGAGEDYESGTRSYELTVRASDGGVHSDVTVIVNIGDVPEAPAFAEAGYAFSLAENADGGTVPVSLGLVQATDPENSPITYSIEGGDPGGLFAIDPGTGALSYRGAGEDYESGTRSYELTVRASDGGVHSDVTVIVNIGDVPEAPAFAEAGYAFSLAENADGGTNGVSLGTVTATDPDNDPVAYSIEGGNESGSFEIDAASGELFYIGTGEDYESDARAFELTVRASDDTHFADATVTIGVTDVPEQAIVVPVDPENLQSVSEPDGEDLPTNTSTIGRVAVSGTATGDIGRSGDRDGFAVELVAGRTYIIDLRGSETGDGTLNDPYLRGIKGPDGSRIRDVSDDDGGEGYNSQLNFTPTESGTHYIIAGAYSGLGTYEVEVRDVSPQTAQQETVNGPPAFGQASYGFTLAENADGGTVPVALGLVRATDPENEPITYSIEGGDPGGVFAIDPGTGALSYRGAGEDYESETRSYELTVRASDGGLHTDMTVNVNVTDVAEAPAFAETSYTFDLAENAGGDTIPVSLGSVTATDPENSPITYSIESGDSGGLFAIDPGTGALSYRGAGEDYESETKSYELTVRASDGGLHSDVTVNVNVTDVADVEEYVSLQQEASVSEPDGEDLPADVTTTGEVAVGGSAMGEIEFSGDRDWFAVELDAGRTYRIDLEGSRTWSGTLDNPYLYGIHDANGVLLPDTTNGSHGLGLNSRVYFTPSDAGTYYVAAGADGNKQGTYTVSVLDITDGVPDDFAAGVGTTATVVVGESAMGEIEARGDSDWFAVELEAGKAYRFNLNGWETADGTLYIPSLRGIHDAGGVLIAGTADDHRGQSRNSETYFEAAETGTYYVAAGGGYYGRHEGTYTLSVVEVTDDFGVGILTTGVVEVGSSAAGEINYVGDRDWFAVELEAGKSYVIELEGQDTGAGTLPDPFIWFVHNAAGQRLSLSTDDNRGQGLNSRVHFTASAAGVYYVGVGTSIIDEQGGTYELSLTEAQDDFLAGPATQGTVAVGGSVGGAIDFKGDSDWFAVDLEAGKSYQIDLMGSEHGFGTLDSPEIGKMHNADGVPIPGMLGIDFSNGHDARSFFTASKAGTHYVKVGNFNVYGEGTYVLSVTEAEDDFQASPETTGTVPVDGLQAGNIDTFGDRDWFAVDLEADKTYQFDVRGSLGDPRLIGLHDEDGLFIPYTADNNSGAGYDSQAVFTVAEDGTYYVAVGATGLSTGAYEVEVTDITDTFTDDFAVGPGTTGTVPLNGSVTGEIEFASDIDWLVVEFTAGTTYRIELRGLLTGDGTLQVTHLDGLYDASGTYIRGTTDGPRSRRPGDVNWERNSELDFTAQESGTHFIAVDGFSDYMGTYTVSVDEVI